MQDQVRDNFMEFTEKLEGDVRYMFLDNQFRVGTAMGIDLDANAQGRSTPDVSEREGIPKATKLRWRVRGNPPAKPVYASKAQIEAEWRKIKAMWIWGVQEASYYFYNAPTTLEVDDTVVKKRVEELLNGNERLLKLWWFPDFEQWPADAQLAVLSMTWSGVGTLTTKSALLVDPDGFRTACKKMDFEAAANLCAFRNPTGSIVTRNKRNRDLFLNADAVLARPSAYQITVLYYMSSANWLTNPTLLGPQEPERAGYEKASGI